MRGIVVVGLLGPLAACAQPESSTGDEDASGAETGGDGEDESDDAGDTGEMDLPEAADHCVAPTELKLLGPSSQYAVSPDSCHIVFENSVTFADMRLDAVWLDGEDHVALTEPGVDISHLRFGSGTDRLAYLDQTEEDQSLLVTRGQYGRGEPEIISEDVFDFRWNAEGTRIISVRGEYFSPPFGKIESHDLLDGTTTLLSKQAILIASDFAGGSVLLEDPDAESISARGTLVWAPHDGSAPRVWPDVRLGGWHEPSGRLIYGRDLEWSVAFLREERPDLSIPLADPEWPINQLGIVATFSPSGKRVALRWAECDQYGCQSFSDSLIYSLGSDPPKLEIQLWPCGFVLDEGLLCHDFGDLTLIHYDGMWEDVEQETEYPLRVRDELFVYELPLEDEDPIGELYYPTDLYALQFGGPDGFEKTLLRARTRRESYSPNPDKTPLRYLFTLVDDPEDGSLARGVLDLETGTHSILPTDRHPSMVLRNATAVLYEGISVGPIP